MHQEFTNVSNTLAERILEGKWHRLTLLREYDQWSLKIDREEVASSLNDSLFHFWYNTEMVQYRLKHSSDASKIDSGAKMYEADVDFIYVGGKILKTDPLIFRTY